jgi:uncharacterized damage-inducible protein DinB
MLNRMQQLQPEQAHFLLHGFYMPSLKNEHAITKGVIHAVPTGKGDYRPNDIAMSAIDLAWHIVWAESMFMKGVVNGAINPTGSTRPESIKTSADVLNWYEQAFAEGFEQLGNVSDEQLMKIIDFRGRFQLPAVIYLSFALNHSIHHRGQLSTYLRPMGAKVPIIYGESYDSKQAAKEMQLTT